MYPRLHDIAKSQDVPIRRVLMTNKIVQLPPTTRRGAGYIVDRLPKPGEKVEVLCSAGGSQHVVPFLCSWTEQGWVLVGTDRRLAFNVVGWRKSSARHEGPTPSRQPQVARSDRPIDLTEAQLAIAALVAEGLLNKQIGHRLGIEMGTVKAHVNQAMKRLGLKNRVQLAVWYVRRDVPEGTTSAVQP